MDSKGIALVVAFTALATALNLIVLPAPYLTTFRYQLGDIVLVIAFMLFGFKIGAVVSVFNLATSVAISPSLPGLIGGPYYVMSIVATVVGVFLFEKFISPRLQTKQSFAAKSAALSTVFSVLTRVLIMLPLDYFVYGFLVSLTSGLDLTSAYGLVFSTMPLIIVYNITVPLYVIPISYYVAKRAMPCKSTLFKNSLLRTVEPIS